ncbi:MAG: hypothetical protein ACPIG7_12180 [Akkermansiaceae bacterium]
MPYLLILVLIIGNLASKAQSASEYTFDDGTGLKTWTVEDSTLGHYFRTKDHEIVLHPKGELPTVKNRRILTPRIHLEIDGTISPEAIAKALGASSFKVPTYSKKDLILTYPLASNPLVQLPLAQSLPGIRLTAATTFSNTPSPAIPKNLKPLSRENQRS